MDSPTFQFSTDDFERLIWDAALDPYAKLVALAIRQHMNHKTRAGNPGILRLAKMCGIVDERTIRRCIADISRVLGVEVTPGAGDPPHPMQKPPTWDVPRTPINPHKNLYTAGAQKDGAANGKAHHPKKARSKRAPIVSYTLDFEEFWQNFRDLMERAGGTAKKNRNNMPKPDAFEAWLALSTEDRHLAKAVLPDYARSAGEWMVYASKYLSKGIYRNFAEDTARKDERRLALVTEFFMRKREWGQNMVDLLGQPPGHPECTLPQDFISKARAMAEISTNGAGYHG
ncbi:MAG: hypothetical protein WBX25_29120 [Rhodomicrobium sp.]